jgi:DNA-binding NarL/FixJ family response regulator
MTSHTPPDGSTHVTRFLIVDDHQEFRREARALLESEGLRVVGEAADGHAALAVTEELQPDIVLLDIGLPDVDGFEVAARLAGRDPAPGIVLISSRDASTYGGRVARSPVAGFLRKDDLSAAAIAELVHFTRAGGADDDVA